MMFLIIFFMEKNMILSILKCEMPFKMHEIICIYYRKPEKILGFTVH